MFKLRFLCGSRIRSCARVRFATNPFSTFDICCICDLSCTCQILVLPCMHFKKFTYCILRYDLIRYHPSFYISKWEGVEGFKEFPSIDLLLMSKPQQRAAAFGVVHFWPLHSTVGFSHCSCFILGFGSGIVAIFGWLLYTSECCNIDTVGSILHN